MPVDGKKKKEVKNMLLSSDESEIEGEETEVEEDSDWQETEDETSRSNNGKTCAGPSTTRTSSNKNKKAAVAVRKTFKRKQDDEEDEDENEVGQDVVVPPKKKRAASKAETENDDEIDGEKTFKKKKKETPATKKKQPAEYDDSNVNKTFKIGCPQSVKPLKVSLNNNYMLACKMIQANENTKGGLSYDYAGLLLLRRTKENKAYEFNMPLSLAPIMLESLQYIMNENKHFFNQKISD